MKPQSHYSCTCLERQEGMHLSKLRKLERSQVRLESGSHLLETVDRQMISGAQIVLVVVLVNGAIGRETALLADKTERRERRQPVKPRR